MIPSLSRVALVNGLGTYRSLTEHEQYLPRYIPSVVSGAISTYDLPDLVAALSPRQVLISGMLNGAGQLFSSSELEKVYPSNGKHIHFSSEGADLLDWIKKEK